MPFPETVLHESSPWTGSKVLDEVLTDYLQWRDEGVRGRLPLLGQVIFDWTKAKASIAEKNKKFGVSFNPLRQIKIPETTHSRLLGDLLNPAGSHGQGDVFLRIFLAMLDPPIEGYKGDDGRWKITVEVGRVDILIWRDWPEKTAIIIENKSNNAGDQQNQIYRYWHHQMFSWDRALWNSQGEADDKLRRERFRLVYLPTSKDKSPATHSTTRPTEWSAAINPFLKVPLECQTVSLPELTLRWVEDAIPQIPKDNTRLRDFIIQYHELWQI